MTLILMVALAVVCAHNYDGMPMFIYTTGLAAPPLYEAFMIHYCCLIIIIYM